MLQNLPPLVKKKTTFVCIIARACLFVFPLLCLLLTWFCAAASCTYSFDLIVFENLKKPFPVIIEIKILSMPWNRLQRFLPPLVNKKTKFVCIIARVHLFVFPRFCLLLTWFLCRCFVSVCTYSFDLIVSQNLNKHYPVIIKIFKNSIHALKQIAKITRDLQDSVKLASRLFSPSAELHEMIKQLSSKNADPTARAAHTFQALLCMLRCVVWLQESDLLPNMIKKQLVGGLQLWGEYIIWNSARLSLLLRWQKCETVSLSS